MIKLKQSFVIILFLKPAEVACLLMVSSLSGWGGWERESGRSEVTCHSLCAPRMLVILSALLCAASAEVQQQRFQEIVKDM